MHESDRPTETPSPQAAATVRWERLRALGTGPFGATGSGLSAWRTTGQARNGCTATASSCSASSGGTPAVNVHRKPVYPDLTLFGRVFFRRFGAQPSRWQASDTADAQANHRVNA